MNFTLTCIAAMMLACCVAQAADLYVAPNGNDAWTGRTGGPNRGKTDGPLATLTHARDEARVLRKAHPGEPVRILLRRGRYLMTAPLELDAGDSGLTIEAYKKEKPVLVGGRQIGGWQPDGDRFWSAPVPEAVGRKWDFRLLVVNNTARGRSRLPETGTFTHRTVFDVPWMSTTGGGWKRKPTEQELTTLVYRPEDLGPWLDIANAELTVYHMWDESVVGLTANDTSTQTLTFSTASGHPPGAFGVQKYVVWNTREGMKKPGQWYLDRTAGKVVYWPLPGEDMAKAEAFAPVVESLIVLHGSSDHPVENVFIRGLGLTVTNTPLKTGGFGAGEFAGAVQTVGTRGGALEDLSIWNVAGQGINSWDASRLLISNCEVRETGACGIRSNGSDLVVSDNLVYHTGLLYPSAIGIWGGGERAEISHNEVHDTPYSAIIGGGDNSRYEYNLIYHAMQELHDGGGIYVTFSKGITLRGNVVRDIEDTGGYGASAYYLDEQSADCLIEGNLSVNVARPSQNHMARNNTLRNNVFIVPGASTTALLAFARCSGYRLEHNVILSEGTLLFQTPPDGIAVMSNNVLFSAAGKVEIEPLKDYAHLEREPLEARDGTRLADPRFADWVKGDYRLRDGSPATAAGIPQPDFRLAGRRRNPGGARSTGSTKT